MIRAALIAMLGVAGGVALAGIVGPIAAWVLATLVSLFVAVAANDLDRHAADVGVRLVRLAALMLPAAEREAHVAEWTDHVLCAADDRQGIRPLVAALGVLVLGAPIMGVVSRYDARRRRAG